MSEFNNRISTQRETLQIINKAELFNEPLLSLADKAIRRWMANNQIKPDDKIIELVIEISGNLFFLANKSQEQVTDEYSEISIRVRGLMDKLNEEINCKAP